MRELLIHAVVLGLFFSCGKESDSGKTDDLGYGRVVMATAALSDDGTYDFEGNNSNKSLVCNESFVLKAFNYLEVASAYTQKAVAKSKFDNEQTRNVVRNYNSLREDLNSTLEDWENKCVSNEKLAQVDLVYEFNLKIRTKKAASNSLIGSLESIPEYKSSLDRLLGAAAKGQTPSLNDIKNAHYYQQTLLSAERPIVQLEKERFERSMNSLVNELPEGAHQMELADFKVAYEEIIEKKLNKKIEYNKAYFSVPSKITRGKSQCLGGTKTDLLLNLEVRGEDYYDNRPVIISAPGHILPGYIAGHGDEFHLYGIETTAEGKAEVYYGNIRYIASLDENILVVDAFDYLFLNAIQHYLDEPNKAYEKLVKRIVKKYGIEKSDEMLHKALSMKSEGGVDSLGSEVFSFGVSTQASGTFQRSKFSSKSKTNASFIPAKKVLGDIQKRAAASSIETALESFKRKLARYGYLSLPASGPTGGVLGESLQLEIEVVFQEMYPLMAVGTGVYNCFDGEELYRMFFDGHSIEFLHQKKRLFKSSEKALVEDDTYFGLGPLEQGSYVNMPQGYIEEFRVYAWKASSGMSEVAPTDHVCRRD